MPSIYEKLGSRGVSSSGGRLSATIKYIAEGYNDISVITKAFGTNGLPGLSVAHPDYVGMICKDFDVTPISGFDDLWEINFKYEQIAPLPYVAPTITAPTVFPNDIDYVELSSEIRAEFQPAWRADPVVPEKGDPGETEDPDTPLGPEVDIEGTPVDAAGVPVSVIRRQQELTLTETVSEPDFGKYGEYRFLRNSRTFLGAKPGFVVYRGCSVRRTGIEVYQVSHQFVYDEWAHLIQQPFVNQNGEPYLISDGNKKRARKVYWIQPFPDKADLNRISSNF